MPVTVKLLIFMVALKKLDKAVDKLENDFNASNVYTIQKALEEIRPLLEKKQFNTTKEREIAISNKIPLNAVNEKQKQINEEFMLLGEINSTCNFILEHIKNFRKLKIKRSVIKITAICSSVISMEGLFLLNDPIVHKVTIGFSTVMWLGYLFVSEKISKKREDIEQRIMKTRQLKNKLKNRLLKRTKSFEKNQ